MMLTSAPVDGGKPNRPSRRATIATVSGSGLFFFFVLFGIAVVGMRSAAEVTPAFGPLGADDQSVPSAACRSCHPASHAQWSASWHGRSVRPFSPSLAYSLFPTAPNMVHLVDEHIRFVVNLREGLAVERGPTGERRFPLTHLVGGKNVIYLLADIGNGKLQTLPAAYDVRRNKWYHTAAGSVRHFLTDVEDAPLSWNDRLYTFNSSCIRCHVSQARTVYHPHHDTYEWSWAEPGINCESCHGSGDRHIEAFRSAPNNTTFQEFSILNISNLPVNRKNSLCASCHARLEPLTPAFVPGDDFFDHFDLATWEHPDFSPDGRDLGENYTMTGWLASPCVSSGRLECMHCHNSGGGFRYQDDPDASCLPCHADRVKHPEQHTNHPPTSEGSRCIGCHMPMTEFARIRRSDHSMRPPTPAATVQFGSPNACSVCHSDRLAAWADSVARTWYGSAYQSSALRQAQLIADARRGDWRQVVAMEKEIIGAGRNPVMAASLLRLMRPLENDHKERIAATALQDPSPLVRAAAVQALQRSSVLTTTSRLEAAAHDSVRVVRVRAGETIGTLSPHIRDDISPKARERAAQEYLASFRSRTDDHLSQFNLGNTYANQRSHDKAIAAYEASILLRPDFVPAYVNGALAYHAAGKTESSVHMFRRALAWDSANAAVNLNLGLLMAELNNVALAESHLRRAWDSDSSLGVAAYNLSILTQASRQAEALVWAQRAVDISPDEPRYQFTLAIMLDQGGRTEESIARLRSCITRHHPNADVYGLLGELLVAEGRMNEAVGVYQAAGEDGRLGKEVRKEFSAKAAALQQRLR